jgi:crotonobetainyl-CoA:carnitine CoA-transferase CaiB-like acyl-CoA transferase
VTPSQLFRASDGWVFVMAQLPKFWTILTERIGRGDLADDPRFRTPADRLANRSALTGELDRLFSTAPVSHWGGASCRPCAGCAVNELDQAMGK